MKLAEHWSVSMVAGLSVGQEAATSALYRFFGSGIKERLFRSVGSENLDTHVAAVCADVARTIRDGQLPGTERLISFVRKRVIHYASLVASSGDCCKPFLDPRDQDGVTEEAIQSLGSILRTLPSRDREVLERLYLHDQAEDQICAEMGLDQPELHALVTGLRVRLTRTRHVTCRS